MELLAGRDFYQEEMPIFTVYLKGVLSYSDSRVYRRTYSIEELALDSKYAVRLNR